MSSGRGEGDERYVAGGERQGPGRVAPRGAVPSPGRAPADPEFSGPEVEPELTELATLLRQAGAATPGPDPEASARMRARLMEAISADGPDAATSSFPAGREEDTADGSVGGTRPLRVARVGGAEPEAGGRGTGLRHGSRRRGAGRSGDDRSGDDRPGDNRPEDGRPPRDAGVRRRRGTRRILSASTMAMCAVLLLGALTVVMSRGALPGEMLYGLKRASESAEIGLTSGQEAKATKHLDIAATRLDEVTELISQGGTSAAGSGPVAAGVDDADATLIADNLRAFDEQARQGARLLLPLTARPAGPSPAVLAEWARQQSAHLNTVAPSLPPSGRTQLASSRDLMDQMSRRADALSGDRPCSATSAGADELGPLPSAAGCGAAAPLPTAPAPSTTTPESTSSTRRTTESTTTTRQSTSTSETTDEQQSDSAQRSSSQQPPRIEVRTPSIPVPVPVPGLPKVDLPPILPGLPGISLGG